MNVSVEDELPSGAEVFVSVQRPGTTGTFVAGCSTPLTYVPSPSVAVRLGDRVVNGSRARLNVSVMRLPVPDSCAVRVRVVVVGVGDCVRLLTTKPSSA